MIIKSKQDVGHTPFERSVLTCDEIQNVLQSRKVHVRIPNRKSSSFLSSLEIKFNGNQYLDIAKMSQNIHQKVKSVQNPTITKACLCV
jgi:hypothetical protein